MIDKTWRTVVVAVAIFLTPVVGNAADKPNVLFLLTDDQRPDTVAALGNPHIQTPTIDRLVEQGMSFNNAYCMGSTEGAVCLPSRAMLLSGRSLFRIEPNSRRAPYKQSFPQSMKEAGYATYHHGKSGNTPHGIHKEFDVSKYLSDDEVERNSGYPGREIADAAVDYLKGYNKEKPLFMYLAFGNPHDPRGINTESRAKYDDAKIPLPSNYMPLHPFNNGEMNVRDEQLAPWPRTEADTRKQLGDYYAVMTYLDMQIGRILNVLKEIGEYDNTIIVFTSDHGLAMGSHGLFGKQNLYEHSMRSPLVITGPGVSKGSSDAMVYLYDIYPTICELAGSTPPAGIEGKSFARSVQDPATPARETVFLAYKDVQRAVRHGDWKLLYCPKVAVTQLFNLKEDPEETKNLADDHPEEVSRLMALLEQQQELHGDPSPLRPDKIEPAGITADQLNKSKAANKPAKANKQKAKKN